MWVDLQVKYIKQLLYNIKWSGTPWDCEYNPGHLVSR